MSQQEDNNNSSNNNVPASPVGAGCTPFQPNSFLCGAFHGMFPDSPINTSYYNDVQNCGVACHENNGDSDEGEDDDQNIMESLNDKFRPHLCEDREFYVINHGTISADAESLSLPSFNSHGLLESPTQSPSRRDDVPSSSSHFEIHQKQKLHLDTDADDAPYSTMMYPADDDFWQQQGFLDETSNPSTPTRSKKGMEEVVVSQQQQQPQKANGSPSKSTTSPTSVTDSSHNEDSERLKKLLHHYSPDKSEQSTKSNRLAAYMPSVVQPCMAPPTPQQPPESMVVYENGGNNYADEAGYWKQRFELAATKVIENSSTTRCMEIIDPTIPRASDAQRRLQMEQESNIKKRQHYRKVLKKYKKHRLLVLILDPSSKLYEVLELPFRPDETTVADVLIMARIQTTDDRLRYQEYVGLCRPLIEPPPPPPKAVPTRYRNNNNNNNNNRTPPRAPPRVNRMTGEYYQPHNDDADRDGHSFSSESTANTSNNSSSHSTTHDETTCPEDLVASLLPPSPSCALLQQQPMEESSTTTSSLPIPILGDIVVTIPQGYSGEEVSKYAQAILQTPMFLRWIQKRYLNDLQRDNDELLSRAAALEQQGDDDDDERHGAARHHRPGAAAVSSSSSSY